MSKNIIVHVVKHSTQNNRMRHTFCGIVYDAWREPKLHASWELNDKHLFPGFGERWCKRCSNHPLAILRDADL